MSVLFQGGALVIKTGGILTDATGIDCCCGGGQPCDFTTCSCTNPPILCGSNLPMSVDMIVNYNAANHQIVVNPPCSPPWFGGLTCAWTGTCPGTVDGFPNPGGILMTVTCISGGPTTSWLGKAQWSINPERLVIFNQPICGCPSPSLAWVFFSAVGCTFIRGTWSAGTGPVAAPSRGFGDTIATMTKAVGIEPCVGCEERRQLVNEWTPEWARRLFYGGSA